MTGNIDILRPTHWIKNLIVFLPMFFGGEMLDASCLLRTALACACFCMACSSIYCLNDILDLERDRSHPQKRLRPLARGAVSKSGALLMMGLMATASLAASYLLLGIPTACVIALYLALNILYCFKLKHIAIVDVLSIALGFELRIFAGGFVGDIQPSHWIVMMIFLLTLCLGFAKRRDDLVLYNSTGSLNRDSVKNYNLTFLDSAITILSGVTLVCYIMYTVSPDVMARLQSQYVYGTSLFVIAGILRYLQLTIVEHKSGSPTRIVLHDGFIKTCIFCWVGTFFALLYL